MRYLACSLMVLSVACGSSTVVPVASPKGAMVAPANQELSRLTVEQVEAKLAANDGKTFVFDDNDQSRFSKGHVPGAKWLLASEVNADKLPADKGATLVFYCANESCTACHSAATAALGLGYTNVFIMPEGIMGWEKKGKKTEG